MSWTFDEFGGDVWVEDGGSDWRPDDLGGGETNTTVISDDDYDLQGGTNPLTGLPVGSGEVGYGTSGGASTGALTQLAKALGLTGKDGNLSLSKLLGLGGAAASLMGAGSAGTVKTPAELQASLPSNTPPMWSAEQVASMQVPLKAGNQLTRQYAADMPTPIRPGQGYAEGGEVEGPLSAMFDSSQGDTFVQGPGDGQSDSVDAKLARGEYVFDAETVSMLGDGSNEAGAERLDELRAQIRAHKRAAPVDEIAPPSMGALSYMNGGLNG